MGHQLSELQRIQRWRETPDSHSDARGTRRYRFWLNAATIQQLSKISTANSIVHKNHTPA
jgi:hypothetical protein